MHITEKKNGTEKLIGESDIQSKKVTVAVTEEYDSLRIYIGNLLHFSIKTNNIICVHSWIEGEGNKYCVEYITATNQIRTEYYRRDLWEQILKGLQKITII